MRKSGAKFLLHGTILTDIEETVAGIKRQHNILAQLGIDPQKEYGYHVLEPLETLSKDGVREVARLYGRSYYTDNPDAEERVYTWHDGQYDVKALVQEVGGWNEMIAARFGR